MARTATPSPLINTACPLTAQQLSAKAALQKIGVLRSTSTIRAIYKPKKSPLTHFLLMESERDKEVNQILSQWFPVETTINIDIPRQSSHDEKPTNNSDLLSISSSLSSYDISSNSYSNSHDDENLEQSSNEVRMVPREDKFNDNHIKNEDSEGMVKSYNDSVGKVSDPSENEDEELVRHVSNDVKIVDSILLTPSFIQTVYNLINSGEFEILNTFVEKNTKIDCELILSKPKNNGKFIGNGIFAKFIQSIFETSPDLVMSVPVIKYHGKGGYNRIIESSYTYDATYLLVNGKHSQQFRDDVHSYDFIDDTVDKLVPQKRLEKYRKIVSDAKESNKLISVKGRGGLYFYLDEFTNRIGKIRASFVVTQVSKYNRSIE